MDDNDIENCRFVAASAVFRGFPKLSKDFFASDLPWSFGDANRTLVTFPDMFKVLEDIESFEAEDDDECGKMLEDFRVHCEAYLGGSDIYIDLES